MTFLFVQTAFVQKTVSKMGKRNEWKLYTVNRMMHSKKYSGQRYQIKKEVSISIELMIWMVWKGRPNVCLLTKNLSECDAIRGTRSAYSVKLWQQINALFSAIAKLASFQVICSNINPDTAADVKKRVVDKKNC